MPMPPTGAAYSAGADAGRSRRTTAPMVVAWTSIVNSTTPNVMSCSSARCGDVLGQGERRCDGHCPAQPRPEQHVEPGRRDPLGEAGQRGRQRHAARAARRRSAPGRRAPRGSPRRSATVAPASRSGDIATPTSRNTRPVSRNASSAQAVSMTSATVPCQHVVAEVAQDERRGDRGEHAGQPEAVRDEEAAVGEDDRDRQLDEGLVDPADDARSRARRRPRRSRR